MNSLGRPEKQQSLLTRRFCRCQRQALGRNPKSYLSCEGEDIRLSHHHDDTTAKDNSSSSQADCAASSIWYIVARSVLGNQHFLYAESSQGTGCLAMISKPGCHISIALQGRDSASRRDGVTATRLRCPRIRSYGVRADTRLSTSS